MNTELAMLLTVLLVLLLVAARAAIGASGQPAEVATRFVPTTDPAALDRWWEHSHEQPVALFLHDPSCPISARAYRQMAQLGGTVPLIDVRHGRQLSQRIEAKTGVRHESPQVLVLWQGQACWSASHYEVTTDAVSAALREAPTP